MKQKTSQSFTSDDGKIQVICDGTTALGELHDFLLVLKGHIVDRMIKAQKEEEAMAEAHKKKEEAAQEKPEEVAASPKE